MNNTTTKRPGRQRFYVAMFDAVWSMNETQFRALCKEAAETGCIEHMDNHGKQLSHATSRRLLNDWCVRVIQALGEVDWEWELEWLDMEPVERLGN